MLDFLRRLARLPLALLMILVCVFGLVSPASAFISAPGYVDITGGPTAGTNTQGRVTWQKQADGTGVLVNWFGLSTTNCTNPSFETSGAKWYSVLIRIFDGNTGVLLNSVYPSPSNICDPTFQINRFGYDEGFVRVDIIAYPALRARTDPLMEWTYDLYPSGNSVLVSATYCYC